MKTQRKTLMFITVIAMAIIWAVIAFEKGMDLLNGLNLFVFILIIILSIVLLINTRKKDRDKEIGLPVDDELSTRIKYKAGYYAYLSSMYMWMFIFFFKRYFPSIETMLGGGILLSAAMAVGIKYWVKYNYHEE